MSETFYPFVGSGEEGGDGGSPQGDVARPTTPARIAVYDDMAMTPRVVLVEPSDIRTYLDDITSKVYELASARCDEWSFMLIREIVENFIHASFSEPTISILDKGRTLVFSDQGPGIPNKAAAMKPSFSSATAAMKRYIRGVGSGLPIVEHQLELQHGTITIEDNINKGTIVTVSLARARQAQAEAAPSQPTSPTAPGQAGYQQAYAPEYPQAAAQQGGARQGYGAGAALPGQQGYPYPYGAPQQPQPTAYPAAQPGYPAYYPFHEPAYQGEPWGYQAAQGTYPAQLAAPTARPGAYTPQTGALPSQPGVYAPAQPAAYQGAQALYEAQPQAYRYHQTAGYPAQPGGYPAAQPGGARAAEPGAPWGAPADPGAYPGQSPYGAAAASAAAPAAPRPAATSPAERPSGIDAHVPLTSGQREVVLLFGSCEKVGPKELSEHLGIPPATGSRRLKELAEAGVVTKQGQKYVLTGEGRRLFACLEGEGR